jgi:acyl-coenzyme A synthetase/AMP-(fatty) acid ligase
VLRPGFARATALAREIQEFVKVQLAAHEYPRFVEFAETLPMTATGKVLRRELRARVRLFQTMAKTSQAAGFTAPHFRSCTISMRRWS